MLKKLVASSFKVEATCYSEKLVTTYRMSTRCHIPEHHSLVSLCSANLTSQWHLFTSCNTLYSSLCHRPVFMISVRLDLCTVHVVCCNGPIRRKIRFAQRFLCTARSTRPYKYSFSSFGKEMKTGMGIHIKVHMNK